MTHILNLDPYDEYPLEYLQAIKNGKAPKEFEEFWQSAYQNILSIKPEFSVSPTGKLRKHWKEYIVSFKSTDEIIIKGWLLIPVNGPVKRAFVVSHGYGGRSAPDYHLPYSDAALFFPCMRGISLSKSPPISDDPYWHVIHDIHLKHRYILRGCVEDLWLSTTVLASLYPNLENQIFMLGISFGGGLGVLALSQDIRIAKAHFNVPTFGNYKLRLKIPTEGSSKSLQDFFKREPRKLVRTVRLYDASYAARSISVPVHFALALKDRVVTPPGQFSIYNEVKGDKELFVLDAGHENYPRQHTQYKALKKELMAFFS